MKACPHCGSDEYISQYMSGVAAVPCQVDDDGTVQLYDSPGPHAYWEEDGVFCCGSATCANENTFTL